MKVPDGWKKTSLGKIFEFKNGVNAEKSSYGQGIKFINIMDIFQGNFILAEKISGKILLSDKKIKKNLVIEGDVLFNRTSEISEEIALTSVYLGNEKVVFGGFVIKGHPKDKSLDNMFKKYCFFSENVRKEIIRRGQGAVRTNIGQKDLSKVPILLPPLPEQKSIANLLSTWDEVIKKTERLIQAKEKQFNGYVQRLIDQRCTEWTHIKPKKIFDTITEKNYPDEELLSVTQNRGVIPRSMLEGRVMSPNGTTASYKLIKSGDFAISLRSFQGGVEYSNYQGIISPAYTVLRPKIDINTEFYRHFFKTYIFIEKYLNLAVIGIRDGKQISIPDFMSIKIPVPPLEEQKQIAEALSTAQQEIDLLKHMAEKYKTQKRGLMQKLLTGEWRVKGRTSHV
jgi:type I restriction enzyme S subunit